jgi:hypothetical protein
MTSLDNFRNLVDHYHVWESNLENFSIPHVYKFPKFVSRCVSSYTSSKITIVGKYGFVICTVDSKTILDTLKLSTDPDVEELNITKINRQYLSLNSQDRITLL